MDMLDRIEEFLVDTEEIYWEDAMIESMVDFLAMLDLDSLSECQIEKLDEIIELMEEDEFLSEQVGKVKRVVRGGKKIRRRICKSGYKLVDGKCKKMSQSERRKRSIASKRGSRKKRGKKREIARRRNISMRRR